MNSLVSVPFHDDEILAHEDEHGDVYVLMKRVCENLGLSWNGQYERIQRHQVLSGSIRVIRMEGEKGVTRDHVTLPLVYLHGWLFGVDTSRVKDAIRDKLIAYQTDCFRVIANHFMGRSDPLPMSPARQEHYVPPEDALVRLACVTEARRTFGKLAAQQIWQAVGLPPVGNDVAGPSHELEDWIKASLVPCPGSRLPTRQVYAAATGALGFDVTGQMFGSAAPAWAAHRKLAKFKGRNMRCLIDVKWRAPSQPLIDVRA